METIRSLFLSDLHLGTPDCRATEILRCLHEVDAQAIFLLGDIVDLSSLARRPCWPAAHGAVLAEICVRARAGVRVMYLPGNHDAAVRDLVGLMGGAIELQDRHVHVTATGTRLLILHGDQFEESVDCSPALAWLGAVAYDLTLTLTRWLNALRRLVGRPDWALITAVKRRLPVAARYIRGFEAAAVQAAREAGTDGVVCGHIHEARLRRQDGVLYANTGDWVESCTALIEDQSGALKLWRRTATAEVLGYDPIAAPLVTGA